ncbi:hypothetical protein F4604DRAFT_1880450 [Suillus subluteus]|nr:hypothetical protein F4604DRAFT_1880450 [Suillus subluteus]
MEAFIRTLLGSDHKDLKLEGGALGVVKAHYGCVEAQGRGSLHCHMFVWVEGGLDLNEIKQRVFDNHDEDFKDRLLRFLDDCISTCVPEDPDPSFAVPLSSSHPCSVRGINVSTPPDLIEKALQKDLFHLAEQCQRHRHSATCWKYWKGPPNPRVCCFDLDENNYCSESHVDPETEEICLRCLDGLVNNFNSTMLWAIRCNMDIKFIGSGASVKAMMYYITDYITKAQLKVHIAYAALERATKKLGEYDPNVDDITMRAKLLLQKCAYSMLSHQELSGQQLCSYLMDFLDHYTSHRF